LLRFMAASQNRLRGWLCAVPRAAECRAPGAGRRRAHTRIPVGSFIHAGIMPRKRSPSQRISASTPDERSDERAPSDPRRVWRDLPRAAPAFADVTQA
jgi:hypothetical protein